MSYRFDIFVDTWIDSSSMIYASVFYTAIINDFIIILSDFSESIWGDQTRGIPLYGHRMADGNLICFVNRISEHFVHLATGNILDMLLDDHWRQ